MFMALFLMKQSNRLYGLDALRGVAMVLGIFLHASISYKHGYHYGNWVFDKEFTSWFFDWLYLWINSFRMQTFFLLAGFFAHILVKKNGLFDFAVNRVKRIGLVLLLSYFTILPLTLAPYLLVVEYTGADRWSELFNFYLRFYTFRAHSGFMHLWFLQHLVVYYGLTVGLLFLSGKIKLNLMERLGALEIKMRVGIFFGASSLALCLVSLLFNTSLPSIWTGFVIPVPQFLYYLFFFLLGWFLENSRNLFSSFVRDYKLFLIVGIGMNFIVLYFLNASADLPIYLHTILLKFIFSLQTISLIIGFVGLFNSKFQTAKPFWSYIADSAYWVYLIHMPIVLITQLLLLNSSVAGILKFPIVILITMIISFGSYHILVRYTWIGSLLNGRRVKN